MFDVAEIPQKLEKAEYEAEVAKLRVALVNAQYDLAGARFPVIIEIAGDDWAACVEGLRSMYEWMDARHIEPHPLEERSDEEHERPHFWRYWRRLPRDGRIGVFLEGWTTELVLDALDGGLEGAKLEQRLEHVKRFEQLIVDGGALLLKFWFHLGKKELGKRLKSARKDPTAHWWMDEEKTRQLYDRYDESLPIAEHILSRTSSARTPWTLINSADARYRNLALARAIHGAISRRLESDPTPPAATAPAPDVGARRTLLETVDLSSTIGREDYERKLEKLSGRLGELTQLARRQGMSSIVVMEGWDAAGKGGIIRRLTRPIDVRHFKVFPIAAPTEEELAHPYLWRFWKNLPPAGKTTVFDRSWYGRVLVERVEKLASEQEWRRAYSEIRDFEEQLCEHGVLLRKFWIHIDPAEQLERFEARARTTYKKHKLTDDDYRNRDRWDDYATAVDEMVARTSTGEAPWHIVAGNDKRFARIEVLRTLVKALEQRL